MLQNKESFRLLYQAIKELSERMGDDQLETYSISLLLLDFDFEDETFDQLLLAFSKYIDEVGVDHINHSEFLALIDKTIPEDRELNLYIKNKIIIGFANNYFPELQVLANEIKTDMAIAMVKDFN
ncbi:hypothetical protein DOS71_07155 [Staphylococcus felis]|uniref:hypothetical protein n=1 Tax=Staphylococcus felis TaxID=46127 RepID=UPI000E241EE2|nr:hypothetical protein [Staphylococcus felis]REI09472.1 hypothetical protein DOS71_07155 [Staphylococcus felis]